MAFSGYLIGFKDGNGTLVKFPIKYMRYETYKTSPDQRLDLDSTRDTTGVLHRTVLNHTATKVEFNMPYMDKTSLQAALKFIKDAFGYPDGNTQARKLRLRYYDEWTDDYKEGIFYVPDIQFTIRNIDAVNNKINYGETRIAFIEY